MNRVYNFSAGPGVLPVPVLEEVAKEFPDYHGTGMSLVEMSHRGQIFSQIIRETRDLLRELLGVPETHDILFLQGGGHMQFAMVPLNLLGAAAEASYIVNGVWSKKAAAEAGKFCRVSVIGTPSRAQVPHPDSINVPNDAAYLYYCMNETVNGLEFNYIPQCPDCVPLVSDVSSNFLSRSIDFQRHALVLRGSEKLRSGRSHGRDRAPRSPGPCRRNLSHDAQLRGAQPSGQHVQHAAHLRDLGCQPCVQVALERRRSGGDERTRPHALADDLQSH